MNNILNMRINMLLLVRTNVPAGRNFKFIGSRNVGQVRNIEMKSESTQVGLS